MEIFPLVDEKGLVIGKASREICHNGSKPLHPVVHLHVFDAMGRLFLQKRSMLKDIQPGKWDTSVGGHVIYGETIEEALRRESREELGLETFQAVFVDSYVFESEIERELVHIYQTVFSGTLHPDEEELDGGAFFSFSDIDSLILRGVVTPNFASEFRKYKQALLNNFFTEDL
jgi:isopentenyldiphosphate isomerase